ncbi:hypothetical protein [Mycobacterium sp. 29Ha]|uniref:hypothetical protein n=1 Tax=Mycobacterium sp. 29Ha TaxID=2939268 RepID=UPI0029391053|nr:hypothetical protein [Mycobacterium sp. 29Ha]MDV3133423.1 hypothetical protein [Mycobacterium sp. 29Ha]
MASGTQASYRGAKGQCREGDVVLAHSTPSRAWPHRKDSRGHWTIDAELRLAGGNVVLATACARFVESDPA